MLFEIFEPEHKHIYVIKHTLMILSDGYEKNGETLYKRCDEHSEIYPKAFLNYEEAAQNAVMIIQSYTNNYGIEWDPDDLKKWDWFFIGFHHGCRIRQKHDPEENAMFDKLGIRKQHRVLKIEIVDLILN